MAVDATKSSHTKVSEITHEVRSTSSVDEHTIEADSAAEVLAQHDDSKAHVKGAKKPSAHVSRSSYILKLVAAYASLAIFARVVMCIISHRPITTAHYG